MWMGACAPEELLWGTVRGRDYVPCGMKPLAYHITWGTYGTRLHGDPRKTVVRGDNVYGTPVLGLNRALWEEMKGNLKFAPRRLTREQMVYVERIVPEVCARGGWEHRESAAGPDHVHVVLTSGQEPSVIRRILKRWGRRCRSDGRLRRGRRGGRKVGRFGGWGMRGI